MAEKKELASKSTPFSVQLTNKMKEMANALPSDLNQTRWVANCVACLNDNKSLMDFAKSHGTGQIIQGMMKASYLNLDFMNKEAYLIPYGNTLQFIVDYRGNIKLAKKYSSRPIKEIYAKIVREGDEFTEEIINGEPTISFKPKAFNNGDIIGAFAVCQYIDGGMIYDVMSKDEIESSRNQSKAKNSPAWQNFYGEMSKKTVLHRLCKMLSLDFSAEQRKTFDEEYELADTQEIIKSEIDENANTIVFDAEAVEVVGDENED